jgi:hypothetical protein
MPMITGSAGLEAVPRALSSIRSCFKSSDFSTRAVSDGDLWEAFFNQASPAQWWASGVGDGDSRCPQPLPAGLAGGYFTIAGGAHLQV